jgi:hypothetical protein
MTRAALRLDDESVSSDEPDNVGWFTRLEPVPEELGTSWPVPAIAAQDRHHFWSQSP